jgi:hypothetical protein
MIGTLARPNETRCCRARDKSEDVSLRAELRRKTA